jgi:bacterioferritin-associated ferredoxin
LEKFQTETFRFARRSRRGSFLATTLARAIMILCSCNVISDRAVRAAQEAGASRAREVFLYCNQKPKCGRCIRGIRQELDAHRSVSKEDPTCVALEPACA